jgi:hypothetical protein
MKFGLGLFLAFLSVAAVAEHNVVDKVNLSVLPYYEYEPGQTTLQRQGPSLDGKGRVAGEVGVRRILVTPTPFLVTKRVLVGTKCTGGVAGDGSKGDWAGYFEAPKEKKAAALAKAIKGIGPPTAQRIVNDGRFFKSKPKSWKAFKEEIFKIQNELKIAVISNVLDQNGSENMKNLGYKSETGTCEDIYENQQFLDYEEVRRLDKVITRKVEANFTGAPLLKGESESFEVGMYIGPQGEQLVSLTPPAHYNTYGFQKKTEYADTTSYDFKGSRNQVKPSPDMVQVTPRIEDGKLKFNIVNNSPDAGGNVTVAVTAKIKKGLFKSGQSETSFTLKGDEGTYDTGSSAESGKTYYYTYTVQVNGSTFLSGEKSSPKSQSGKP